MAGVKKASCRELVKKFILSLESEILTLITVVLCGQRGQVSNKF
jgi:hypothetical protein